MFSKFGPRAFLMFRLVKFSVINYVSRIFFKKKKKRNNLLPLSDANLTYRETNIKDCVTHQIFTTIEIEKEAKRE